MADRGLLFSGVVIAALLYAASRWLPVGRFERSEVLDQLVVPVVAGVLAGRAVAAALDDPASLRSLRAFLVIRGGVELWPGVAAAAGALAVGLRRRGGPEPVLDGLAVLAPFLLLAYAGYEATCVLRDGCYGPASPVGLVPDGLQTRQFPVGLVVAAVVLGLAWRLATWSTDAGVKLVVAVGGVAMARAVASIWLPRLGDGLTRPHRESIAIAVVAAGTTLVLWRLGRFQAAVDRHASADAAAATAAEGDGAAAP